MSDYTALQSLRAEVTEPTPAQLAPAFARLDRAMREATPQEQEVRIADPVPAAAHVGNRKRVGRRARIPLPTPVSKRAGSASTSAISPLRAAKPPTPGSTANTPTRRRRAPRITSIGSPAYCARV